MIDDLMKDLCRAIEYRKYGEAEQIGLQMLDHSPSEEVDRFINDIITSATTINDAEDEIRYQVEDLKTALKNATSDSSEKTTEVDGL
jgi:hypothetical protein